MMRTPKEKLEQIQLQIAAKEAELKKLRTLEGSAKAAVMHESSADVNMLNVPKVSPQLSQKQKRFNEHVNYFTSQKKAPPYTLYTSMSRITAKLSEVRRTKTLQDEEDLIDQIMPDLEQLRAATKSSCSSMSWKLFGKD